MLKCIRRRSIVLFHGLVLLATAQATFAGPLPASAAETVPEWRKQSQFLADRADKGEGWAGYFLSQAYLKRLRAPDAPPLRMENIPAPKEARPYYDANVVLGSAKEFSPTWDKWWALAAALLKNKHGPTLALVGDGYALGEGPGHLKDPARAAELYEQAAASGHPETLAKHGLALLLGRGTKQDPAAGLELLRKAHEGGSLLGLVGLAYAHQAGVGTNKDLPEAIVLYKGAMERGSAFATEAMARLYREGQGVKKDLGKAIELFREAARLGNGTANRELGWAYFRGEGVAQDKKAAVRWWADGMSRDDECLRLYAWMMAKGEGMRANYQVARYILLPAYFKKTITGDQLKRWADEFRAARHVSAGEVLRNIAAVKVELTLDKELAKLVDRKTLIAAARVAAKKRGLKIDDKATATLRVRLEAFAKADPRLLEMNGMVAHACVLYPAVVRRGTKFYGVNAMINTELLVKALPVRLPAPFANPFFEPAVGLAVEDAVRELLSPRGEPAEAPKEAPSVKQSDLVVYTDYWAAQYLRDETANIAWLADAGNMREPETKSACTQDAKAAREMAERAQRELMAQLKQQGITHFDPKSSHGLIHYVVLVQDSMKLRNHGRVENTEVWWTGTHLACIDSEVFYQINGHSFWADGWLDSNNPVFGINVLPSLDDPKLATAHLRKAAKWLGSVAKNH